MLLKLATLEGIRRGEITLAFRRWKRPTVRAGGRLRTRIGELAIEAVDAVSESALTARAARRAGFATRAELVDALGGREGTLYRIRLHLAGEDTRIALRNTSKLTKAELQTVTDKLARTDARSADGPWTLAYLRGIEASPGTRAADLAEDFGMAKAPFKARIRRLKELGLTESLAVGYRLSPRGKVVWKHLEKTSR